MEYQEITDWYKELREKLRSVIDSKSSLDITNIEDMDKTFIVIEEVFKEKNTSNRIRTEGRSLIPSSLIGGGAALVGASAAVEGVVAVGAATAFVATAAVAGAAIVAVGSVGLIGIAAHRLFTADPDYEIIKYFNKNEIHITYKK